METTHPASSETDSERLRAAVASRDQLVAAVSHDLREALSASSMSVQVLTRLLEDRDDIRLKGCAEKIERGLKKATSIVDDLLRLDSLESGRIPLAYREHRVCAVAADTVRLLEDTARVKDIRFDIDVGGEASAYLECDPEQLARVFANTVANAIKYSPTGGRVAVRVRRMDDRIRCEVEDRGGGVAAGEVADIFTRGYRSAQNRTAPGLGIGLTIARGIIDAHRGRIWAENVDGGGFRVTWDLPRAGALLDEPGEATPAA